MRAQPISDVRMIFSGYILNAFNVINMSCWKGLLEVGLAFSIQTLYLQNPHRIPWVPQTVSPSYLESLHQEQVKSEGT